MQYYIQYMYMYIFCQFHRWALAKLAISKLSNLDRHKNNMRLVDDDDGKNDDDFMQIQSCSHYIINILYDTQFLHIVIFQFWYYLYFAIYIYTRIYYLSIIYSYIPIVYHWEMSYGNLKKSVWCWKKKLVFKQQQGFRFCGSTPYKH